MTEEEVDNWVEEHLIDTATMPYEEYKKLKEDNQFYNKCNIELTNRISKALHRIQLLQMDGEVSIKDLGKIVRDLRGSDKE